MEDCYTCLHLDIQFRCAIGRFLGNKFSAAEPILSCAAPWKEDGGIVDRDGYRFLSRDIRVPHFLIPKRRWRVDEEREKC